MFVQNIVSSSIYPDRIFITHYYTAVYDLADLSECPGVLAPHEVQLYRHGKQEGGQVRHGQVEQVDVGGGPQDKA